MVARIALPVASLTTSLAALIAMPAIASAQEADAPLITSKTLFPTMGADGSGTAVNFQLGLIDAGGEGDESIVNFRFAGQVVNEAGLGGYASISGTKAGDAEALGSLEVGGVWRRASGGNSDLAIRVGMILPTARIDESGSEDSIFGDFFLHLIGTALTRPSDFLTAVPETTTARVAVTPSLRSGNMVARADVGMDVVMDSPDDDGPDAPYLHIDVGAGYDDGKATALVELSNMIYLDDTDEILHMAAFSAGYHAQGATPYVTVQVPFGDLTEDESMVNLMAGVRGNL